MTELRTELNILIVVRGRTCPLSSDRAGSDGMYDKKFTQFPDRGYHDSPRRYQVRVRNWRPIYASLALLTGARASPGGRNGGIRRSPMHPFGDLWSAGCDK